MGLDKSGEAGFGVLRSSRPSFMKCSAATIRSIALRSNSASAKCRRREVAHGIRNSASTAQLRTKLSRGRDYLDSCHYTAPRFQRGSRSRGHEADNRRGRNCSTARQCARNRVTRVDNYRVLMRIGKVARSKVVRIGNRVARIGNYKVLMRIGKVARSKVVRIGNRVARIGNYRDLCISVVRSRVVRSCVSVMGSRVSVIIVFCVHPKRIHRTVGHCLGASLRRRSRWLYRQRARLSL